ncbi:MAG: dihydrofolate reductase family protein, partial [Anaerolineaceae bacterium]|nr:dihydrofolate reductase family protein [Anaerolineaceae bacterium]
MRKVIFAMSTSLDGFIEGPNGDIGWQVVDAELHRYVNDRERDIGAYLLGRRLYEVMAAYWPTADTNLMSAAYEVEYARIWKSKLKIVFSRTLERVEGNARLVRGDILGEVQRLKAEPG